jgi:PilZ domain
MEQGGDDRRRDERHVTCYPFHIQAGESGETADVEIALIRDLSPSGALLFAREAFAVGTRMKLHLDVLGRPDEVRVVVGRVVRVEPRPPDEAEVWPYAVAVQLDEPHADLEAAIRELARLGG